MKCLLSCFAVALLLGASIAQADRWVSGYLRSDGTYVNGYWRSEPDGLFYNNYSTYGNINPYTGSLGTRRTPSVGGWGYSSGYLTAPRYYPTYPAYPTYPSYRSYQYRSFFYDW